MTDIQELFSRDPLSYTRETTLAIVEYFRAQRHQFKLQEKQGKAPKTSPKPKTEAVNLDDLMKDL